MENKGFKDDIFERELGFFELAKRSAQIIYFFRQPVFISFFLFFIPVLVFIAVVFRNQLAYHVINFNEMGLVEWFFFFIQSLTQQLFFAGTIIFVSAFFERKIFQVSLMINRIFIRLIPFTFTFIFQFALISTGIIAFIIPGIIIAIFLAFSLFLVYSENLWGFDSFKESARTVKAYWVKVFFYFLILNALDYFIPVGVSYILKNVHFFRVELKFFIESLLAFLLYFFPAVFFAVLFYNLRQRIEPKDKTEEPASD